MRVQQELRGLQVSIHLQYGPSQRNGALHIHWNFFLPELITRASLRPSLAPSLAT